MGYSKAQKARTHKRIVAIASKRFRKKGLAGFGIGELMKEAGLTVGGFYKHFDCRDDLVAEAVNSALDGWKRRAGAPSVSLAKLVDAYLNQAHRDNPGTGCGFSAFSALAPEIARSAAGFDDLSLPPVQCFHADRRIDGSADVRRIIQKPGDPPRASKKHQISSEVAS